jgi:hypothetical protein
MTAEILTLGMEAQSPGYRIWETLMPFVSIAEVEPIDLVSAVEQAGNSEVRIEL